MTDLSFTTTNFRAHMIEMRRNGDLVMRVTYEGKVEIGDGYTPSEAGDAFIAELPAAFGRATAAAEKAGYERGLREAAGVAASFTVWPGKTVRQQVANATAQAAEAAILSKLEKTDD